VFGRVARQLETVHPDCARLKEMWEFWGDFEWTVRENIVWEERWKWDDCRPDKLRVREMMEGRFRWCITDAASEVGAASAGDLTGWKSVATRFDRLSP